MEQYFSLMLKIKLTEKPNKGFASRFLYKNHSCAILLVMPWWNWEYDQSNTNQTNEVWPVNLTTLSRLSI